MFTYSSARVTVIRSTQGITHDLTARLSKHNQGACVQASKSRPWKIEIAIAFRPEAKARRFEHYLKTGSGSEFAGFTFEKLSGRSHRRFSEGRHFVRSLHER